MYWRNKNRYLKHVVTALKSLKNSDGLTTDELVSHLQTKLLRNDPFNMVVNVRNALREGVCNGLIKINPERYVLKHSANKKISNQRVYSNRSLSSDQYVKCTLRYHRHSSVSSTSSSYSEDYSRKRKHKGKQKSAQKKKKSKPSKKSPTPESPNPAEPKKPDFQKNDTPPPPENTKSKPSLRNLTASKHDVLSNKGTSEHTLVQRRRSSRMNFSSPQYSSEYIN